MNFLTIVFYGLLIACFVDTIKELKKINRGLEEEETN